MPRYRKGKPLKDWNSPRYGADPGKLRIVGGKYRGRQLRYSGDPITRPMKDDVREAVFNLVGGWTPGKAVFDLFAGTGAMGIEAMSRGALSAVLIERHFPTAEIIKQNVAALDTNMNVQVISSDTFFWVRQFMKQPGGWPAEPWLVFCCPPYSLYVDAARDLLGIIEMFTSNSPPGSLILVESDSRFDLRQLPAHELWTVRQYTPAVISIFKKFHAN
jgi:16S rRNA (guanine(966)-N(2))-methyltransferase RsmD